MIDIRLDRDRLVAVREGATVVFDDSTVFRLTGPAALDCLQGLFTNDVVHPGGSRLVYGAFLTPKGWIVLDTWVLRAPTDLLLILPSRSRDDALALFKRSLPPRLAQVDELDDRWRVCWLFGAAVEAMLDHIEPGSFPDLPGAVGRLSSTSQPVWVARGTEAAPFSALLTGETTAVDAIRKRIIGVGAQLGTADDFHTARVLAGWPAVGAEIGEKTLPQEVRFDEIDGLSHTKGCYTGQETVSRLHFRGHTNKEVRGLVWKGVDALTHDEVVVGDKPVGTVYSTVRIEDRTVALGILRNEVKAGERVVAGGHRATVVELPFKAADIGT